MAFIISSLLFLNSSPSIRTISIALISTVVGFMIGIYCSSYEKPLVYLIPNSATKSVPSSIPKYAENLPPKIIEEETDLYFRRLWGDPWEDLPFKPKYLVAFAVGFEHKDNINKCMQKFSENFTIVLFHYDGRVSEWDEFEWSKRAVHVSARGQTKCILRWFAKRFMHPNVVAQYDFIFIWDEDLGVENFDPEEYINLAKKNGLEISQPGVLSNNGNTWLLTRKQENSEVHKTVVERRGWCQDESKPPCAGFVEIMAPVFSRKAWACVWYMIQNDLPHGWGIDFAFGLCVDVPNEQIGIVDAQWIEHLAFPSLGHQVRERCYQEWDMFKERLQKAEKEG